MLQKNSVDSEFYIMEPVDNFIYHVKGRIKDRVNLIDKTCTFRRFNLDLIFCSHACTAIRYVYNFFYICVCYTI